MSKLLLVIGIVQIVAGVVILGMVAKDFHQVVNDKSLTNTEINKINAFGPVLIALLVIVNGVFGILTMCCSGNKKMEVFYLMGACVAAAASGAMVWIYALKVYACRDIKPFNSPSLTECWWQGNKELRNIHITLLTFSLIACAMSVFGMVTSSLTTCRKVA